MFVYVFGDIIIIISVIRKKEREKVKKVWSKEVLPLFAASLVVRGPRYKSVKQFLDEFYFFDFLQIFIC